MPNAPAPTWTPAFFTPPLEGYFYEEGDKAVALADFAFEMGAVPMRLDDFQRWIVREALQTDADGNFRFRTYLVSLGRQNGKTTIASALLLYLMLGHHPQPNVFAIASTLQQANIVYSRFSNLINSNPHIKKRFRPTTETRGIHTLNGGHLQVAPAKSASLQGHSLTGVVLDEVHLLNEGTFDAVVIGAGQQHNSLIFAITTAGDEESTLLKRLYEQGKAGVDGIGVAIWEAPEGAAIDDLEALKAANPALAEGRMNEDTILQEVRMLPQADALRFRHNRFIATQNAWLPLGVWSNCEAVKGKPNKPVSLVVDVSPGWGAATICAGWMEDGKANVDVLASVVRPSFEQVFDLTLQVVSQVPHSVVAVEGFSGSDLYNALKARGVKTLKLTKQDAFRAASLVYAGVVQGEVRHPHLALLDSQIARTARKQEGDYHRVVRPNTAIEIDAAMSAIYALYLALVNEEQPLQVF